MSKALASRTPGVPTWPVPPERVSHVAECLPEICTLDCGTMNFSLGDYVMTNTPSMLRAMAKKMTDLGVRPEIEAFDTGHLWFAKQLAEEGLIEDPHPHPALHGHPLGAPDDLNTFMAMVNNVPGKSWTFSAFSIGRNALAYPAAAMPCRRQCPHRARRQSLCRKGAAFRDQRTSSSKRRCKLWRAWARASSAPRMSVRN